jgi:hypothetical protein
MRPLRPLPPPVTQASSSRRGKKRKVVLPTRARRQKIDPTLYGAVHTTEAMLQADRVVVLPVPSTVKSPAEVSLVVKPPVAHPSVDQTNTPASEELHDAIDGSLINPFEAERQKDLGLLALLFDGKEKWEGSEDLDLVMEGRPPNDPKETDPLEETTGKDTIDAVQSHSDEDSQSRESSLSLARPPQTESTTRLKDLFALRTTGEKVARHRRDLIFSSPEPLSILHGLDLDLEDDFAFDEIVNADLQTEQVSSKFPLPVDESRPQVRRKGLELQFSNTAPYFFPLDPNERSRGTTKDIMAISAAKGWMQPLLNPMTPYVLSKRRSMTQLIGERLHREAVRKQWESEKVALTRDWKQRHREASKRQRKGTAINDME